MTLIMLCYQCMRRTFNKHSERIKIINQFTEKQLFHGKATANNYTESSHSDAAEIQFMNEFLETLEDQS